jgi:hypothetical protein
MAHFYQGDPFNGAMKISRKGLTSSDIDELIQVRKNLSVHIPPS